MAKAKSSVASGRKKTGAPESDASTTAAASAADQDQANEDDERLVQAVFSDPNVTIEKIQQALNISAEEAEQLYAVAKRSDADDEASLVSSSWRGA